MSNSSTALEVRTPPRKQSSRASHQPITAVAVVGRFQYRMVVISTFPELFYGLHAHGMHVGYNS